MDIFSEQLVVRKKDGKDILIVLGYAVLALALSFVLTVILGAFSFVFVCGTWFGAWWLMTRRNIEYEYIITSAILDIDKIVAKRSRKRIVSIDLKEIERFMPLSEMPTVTATVIDVTPDGMADGAYGIDFSLDGQAKRLIFKPNKKILNSAKMASPRLVELRAEDVGE